MVAIVNAFRSCESRLRAFVRRMIVNDNDIDDICQETIILALKAERQRTIDFPEAFLFGVARNVVRKQLEKESRSLIDFIDDFSPDDYATGEQKKRLWGAHWMTDSACCSLRNQWQHCRRSVKGSLF